MNIIKSTSHSGPDGQPINKNSFGWVNKKCCCFLLISFQSSWFLITGTHTHSPLSLPPFLFQANSWRTHGCAHKESVDSCSIVYLHEQQCQILFCQSRSHGVVFSPVTFKNKFNKRIICYWEGYQDNNVSKCFYFLFNWTNIWMRLSEFVLSLC